MMKRLLVFFLITVIGIVSFQFYVPVSFSKQNEVITIKKGVYPGVIATQLSDKGLIRSPFFFKLYVRINKLGPSFKAGSFLLSPHLSLKQTVQKLVSENGNAQLIRITIPEGYSINDIAERLEEAQIVPKSEFSSYAHLYAKDDLKTYYPFLGDIPVTTIEGYLFPDTYYFSSSMTSRDIVRVMLDEFSKKMMPIWNNQETTVGSPKQRFTFHQTLTIASLIEKEARIQDEMNTISSVFYNRLKKKMLLASDPTVVYALGQGYKKRVFYKDLKIDSPYNTYRYTGFPPSPIASMGTAAFKASLNPIQSQYLFFVANSDGSHHFTKTYDEHLRYQRNR